MPHERNVVVTGDVTIEWRFAQSRSKESRGPLLDPYNYMQLTREAAGATLLAEIIAESIELATQGGQSALQDVRVLAPGRDGRNGQGIDAFERLDYESAFWHSYMVCSEQRQLRAKKDGRHVWRVRERLGVDRKAPNSLSDMHEAMLRIESDRGGAHLIVAEQSKQGYFGEGEPDSNSVDALPLRFWPESLRNPAPNTWILVEWTKPRFDEPTAFWSYLCAKFSGRIVVVVRIEDLRLFGMRVSRAFSWERTVEELCYELNASTTAFAGCAHFVVSFGLSGAVLYSLNESGKWAAVLFYEPDLLEGMRAETFVGAMTGATRCLTAGVALELMLHHTLGTLKGNGIIAGLVAARRLWHEGFTSVGKTTRPDTTLGNQLRFPTRNVAEAIVASLWPDAIGQQSAAQTEDAPAWAINCAKTIVPVNIPDEVTSRQTPPDVENPAEPTTSQTSANGAPAIWSLLSARCTKPSELLREAAEIVKVGDAPLLAKVPTARIGKVVVTDRKELESLRALRELIRNYLGSSSISTPLAIAVFGKPGSGKSFVIKELANDLSGDPKKVPLTFNLSQFANADALGGALQRVQDESSTGSVPLVFWDEFDTQFHTQFGWLRYFLAPMQDGQFQDGAVTHNVGRSIFVFAGATCHSMQQFRQKMSDAEDPNSQLHNAKISDFISRLKGYVDIPDLNYPGVDDDPPVIAPGELDPAIVLRRAILLRSFLSNSAANLAQTVPSSSAGVREHLNIDHGLIDAFLTVRKYAYGARSMEAIVKMSALSGKTMFDRSSLPPRDQMDLHVNGSAFLQLADGKWANDQWASD